MAAHQLGSEVLALNSDLRVLRIKLKRGGQARACGLDSNLRPVLKHDPKWWSWTQVLDTGQPEAWRSCSQG